MTNEKITATEIKEILNDPGFIDYIHDSWLSAIKKDIFSMFFFDKRRLLY